MSTYAGRYDEPLLKIVGRTVTAATTAIAEVYETDGATLATLYTDRTKSVTQANPVSPDGNGNLEFFAEPGEYLLKLYEGSTLVRTDTITVHPDTLELDERVGKLDKVDTSGTVTEAIGNATKTRGRATAVPAAPKATIAEHKGGTVAWMTRDGARIISYRSTTLRDSDDDGATWSDLGTFSKPVRGVRELGNGELLITTENDEAGGVFADVWVSAGYRTPTVTWTKTLSGANAGTSFPGEWSLDAFGDLVFVIEYGTKTVPNNARHGHVSTDNGLTWRTIYEGPADTNAHAHGIAYDPWRDRVWVAQGDTPHTAILYSDNWRDVTPTWTTAATTHLAVGIVAFPECVILTPDDPPAGLWRIPIDANGVPGAVEDDAYVIGPNFTHIGMGTFRVAPGQPAFFALKVTPGVIDRGYLVATLDGYEFTELWADDVTYDGKGPFTAVGPTARGNIVGLLNDDRQANYSQITLPAPTWLTLSGHSTGDRAAAGHVADPYPHPNLFIRRDEDIIRWLWAEDLKSTGGGAVAALLGSRIEVWNLRQAQSDQVRGKLILPDWWTTFSVELLWAVNTVVAGNVRFVWNRYFKTVAESTTTGEASANVDLAVPAVAAQMKQDTLLATETNTPGYLYNFRLARIGGTDALALDAHVVGLQFKRLS